MREMKDSNIPFCKQIPSVWSEIPNRYLFFNHSVKVGNDFLSFQLLSLTTSGVKLKDINEKSGKLPDSYENYQTVEPGDMIFCLFDLDCSAVFSGLSSYAGMITSAYDVYRVNPSYALERFIDYWFQFVFSQRYYKMFSKTIRYTVTSDTFKSIYTPIPPLKEQKKIADFLDDKTTSISTLIANNEAQVEALKRYKQSLITETVTRGLDPDAPVKDSGVEWIGQIPAHWQECRIKNVIFPKEKPVFPDDEIITCFRDGQVTLRKNRREDGFTFSDTEAGYHGVDVGDLVIHGMDAFAGAIGCSDSRGKITPVVHVCSTSGDNRYFMYYLRFMAYGNILMDLANGVRERSSDYRNFARLGIYGIIVPPLVEQKQIADFLDAECGKIDALISLKQSKIEKLTQYRQSLIYEYVTGKKEAP